MMVLWKSDPLPVKRGDRSKISVFAEDEEIDPVGSCVGQRGQRVQAIVDELQGEKIDIVHWSEDPVVYISNALSPSRVTDVLVNEEENATTVIVQTTTFLQSVKEARARLAAKLTGWKIDIKSESDAEELGLFDMEQATELDHEMDSVTLKKNK